MRFFHLRIPNDDIHAVQFIHMCFDKLYDIRFEMPCILHVLDSLRGGPVFYRILYEIPVSIRRAIDKRLICHRLIRGHFQYGIHGRAPNLILFQTGMIRNPIDRCSI